MRGQTRTHAATCDYSAKFVYNHVPTQAHMCDGRVCLGQLCSLVDACRAGVLGGRASVRGKYHIMCGAVSVCGFDTFGQSVSDGAAAAAAASVADAAVAATLSLRPDPDARVQCPQRMSCCMFQLAMCGHIFRQNHPGHPGMQNAVLFS